MSMPRRCALLAALVFAGIGTPGAAQQSSVRRELSPRLTAETRGMIDALADSLAAAGLPADVLYDKAAEGVLKDAGDARILAVVRGLARRLREARNLLGVSAQGDDLAAASSALYAGVPPALIKRAASMRDDRASAPPLSLTLTVLAALVSQHVPAAVASSSLEALVSRGARELDLQEFQRAVERDIQRGGLPTDATTGRTQSMLQMIESRRPPDDSGAPTGATLRNEPR